MGIHIGDGLREKILRHYRIGIEEQYVFPFGYGHALVIGLGKTFVVFILNERDGGKMLPYHSATVVGRIIVNNDHLCIYTPGGLPYRMEAYLKEVLYVIIDDNY